MLAINYYYYKYHKFVGYNLKYQKKQLDLASGRALEASMDVNGIIYNILRSFAKYLKFC